MSKSSVPISGADMNNAPDAVVMDNVTAGYYADQWVLRSVSLKAEAGKVTVVLGPNGAGKSTVLKVLYGLVNPSEGAVFMEGERITEVVTHRRLKMGIAYLPQGHSVFPGLTVQENLELGLWVHRGDRERVREALARCYDEYSLLKPFRHKRAGALSGGQQRILEVARLMLTEPRVVLIDEPSVGVAPNLVDVLYDHIITWRKNGRTVILVDQNVEAAVNIGDYVYTLESGQNRLQGAREDFSGRLKEVVGQWLHLDIDQGSDHETWGER